MAWRALKALIILSILSLHSLHVCAKEARIAYHIVWDEQRSNGGVTLSAYLRTIYDTNNLYLIDVVSPLTAPDVLTEISGYANVRARSVRRAIPHGVSETLELLDGMGELLWWSEEGGEEIDFYIPLLGADLTAALTPGAMRAVLGQFMGYSFFHRAAGNNVYDRTYFDARLVFSRNESALYSLLGPHSRDPEGRFRTKDALLNTLHRNLFVCSGEFLRIATDSRLSTRLLASMANGYDTRDYFFATLALASNTPMITTSSLRCETDAGGNGAACLFKRRSDAGRNILKERLGIGNSNSDETILAALKAHIPRSMVRLDPASSRVLPL